MQRLKRLISWQPDKCEILAALRSDDYFAIRDYEIDDVTLLEFIETHLGVLDGILQDVNFGRALAKVIDEGDQTNLLDSPQKQLLRALREAVRDKLPAVGLITKLLKLVTDSPTLAVASEALSTLGTVLKGIATYEEAVNLIGDLDTRTAINQYVCSRSGCDRTTPKDPQLAWNDVADVYNLRNIAAARGIPEEELSEWFENAFAAYQFAQEGERGTYRLGRALLKTIREDQRVAGLANPASPLRIVVFGDYPRSGTAGQALEAPIIVKVIDANGDAVEGVPVQFEVTVGSGSVSRSSVLSEWLGLAQTTWTLGSTPGPNAVVASLPNVPGARVSLTVTSFKTPTDASNWPTSTYPAVPGWLAAQASVEESLIPNATNGNAELLPQDSRWERGPPVGRFVLLSGAGAFEATKVSARTILDVYPKPVTMIEFHVVDPAVKGFVPIGPAWLLPWELAQGVELFVFREEPVAGAVSRAWTAAQLRITLQKTQPGSVTLRMQIGQQPAVLLGQIDFKQQQERLRDGIRGDDFSFVDEGGFDGLPRPALGFRTVGSESTYIVFASRAGICSSFNVAVSAPTPEYLDLPSFVLCGD